MTDKEADAFQALKEWLNTEGFVRSADWTSDGSNCSVTLRTRKKESRIGEYAGSGSAFAHSPEQAMRNAVADARQAGFN